MLVLSTHRIKAGKDEVAKKLTLQQVHKILEFVFKYHGFGFVGNKLMHFDHFAFVWIYATHPVLLQTYA